jgi:hypothetical protein
VATVTEEEPRIAGETCDRCGAPAAHRIEFRTGELFLCGHHRRQYADGIAAAVKVPRSL